MDDLASAIGKAEGILSGDVLKEFKDQVEVWKKLHAAQVKFFSKRKSSQMLSNEFSA